MKIYTRTGDGGETGIYGGKRLSKNSTTINAIGDVDELNALLGLIVTDVKEDGIKELLVAVQKDLFSIGADLATPKDIDKNLKVVRVKKSRIDSLEKLIDKYDKNLASLKFFILPGGSKSGAKLHLARAICRRAERSVVGIETENEINPNIKIYLNRLSDLLFVLARYQNNQDNIEEIFWKT